MDVHITLGPRGERATQIYRQLLDAILDGRLRTGDRLPATRDLARQLGISRTTVSVAYEQLAAEGYLAARVGAGTTVQHTGRAFRPQATDGQPAASAGRAELAGGAETGGRAEAAGRVELAGRAELAGGAETGGRAEAAGRAGPAPRRVWESLPLSDTSVGPGVRYAFGIGLPDIGLFPFETWRRLVARELRTGALGTGDYGPPEGLPALRAAIARHFGVSRGLRATADDVVVTNGAQQAIDLMGRVLAGPGATVAVEEPGYPPARHAFAASGARVVGVPVDGEGLVVDALPPSARLVYVTPSHQFPLGIAMSPARRDALLAWARRQGAVVVEDDYDSEYRYGGRPLQPMHSIDRGSSVVYIGTFSKTMFPGLRLGFLIAPPSLRVAVHTAKQLTDWHTDTVSQGALARFIDDGLLARHIRRSSRHYAARRGLVLDWLGTQTERFELLPSSAGLHLTALVADGSVTTADLTDVVRRASAAGVTVRSIRPFHVDSAGVDGLMLGYGATPTDQVVPGLRVLESALR
jgi:GntR family transcriptional regulator/MocR family aminotransferase